MVTLKGKRKEKKGRSWLLCY